MGSMLSTVVPETEMEGYHVLHVHGDSPAEKAGIEAFFDFIVAVNGVVLIGNDEIFLNLIQKNKDRQVELKLFSLRTNSFRQIPITPTSDWNGETLLGLKINFCSIKEAFKKIYHILEIHPSSPARFAGLKPFSDYIYGTEFNAEDESPDFLSLIKANDRKDLKIFVYNIEDDSCRSLNLRPNSQWGGEGLIGCGIGSGYLHRIPTKIYPQRLKGNSLSGSRLFNSEQFMRSYQLIPDGPSGRDHTIEMEEEECHETPSLPVVIPPKKSKYEIKETNA